MAQTAPRTRRPPWPRPSRARVAAGVMVLLAAGALAWAPTDPAWVERVYSRGWYAALQPLVTSASSLVPVALLDVWVVTAALAVAWTVWRVVGAPAGARRRALAAALARGLVAAAAVYLLFLIGWGLNYRRLPITAGLRFDPARVTAAQVDAASLRAVAELNALHQSAHAELTSAASPAAMRVRLAPAFAAAQRSLGQQRLASAGRPKVSMLSPYLRWASVDGLVNPLGLEVIVNPDVLPVELPFVIAHEWGHLAGWARESEASYVGWLTCRLGDRAARYSGWLSLYWHLRRDLPPARLQEVDARLAAGPRADLQAIAARLQRASAFVQRASWQTYDQFLKANRVGEGIRSYDEVVTLVLGIEGDADGRPRLR